MRSTLGISQEHSRNTSGVQATRCSSVPRFSCANAEDPVTNSAAIVSRRTAPARRIRTHDPAHLPSRLARSSPLCQEYTVAVKVLTIADDAFRKSRRHNGEGPEAQVAAGNLSHRPTRPAGQTEATNKSLGPPGPAGQKGKPYCP